ncbi:MAG: molybdate ABC transporter substrate-binding protein [Granulosicoccus sp.]
MRRAEYLVIRVVLMLFFAVASMDATAESVLVAAASSLRTVWPNLAEQYAKDTGEPLPRVSFASSGLLTTQIRNGAPFELFLSADQLTVQKLQTLGKTRLQSVEFATGTLQLATLSNSSVAHQLSMTTIATRLSEQRRETGDAYDKLRITMPNPLHAPYGIAAQQALQNFGQWPVPEGQLLAAENAAQTLQFLNTGAVDIAFVPKALLLGAQHELVIADIDTELYHPVAHTMTLLARPSESADALFYWIQSAQAQQILLQHGFAPGQAVSD